MKFIKQNKILCIFTFLWLLLMLFLSHQPGPETAKTSGTIAKLLAGFISNTLGVSVQEQMVHEFIRHAAHIVLYMVLAIDMGLLLRKAGVGWFWIVLLLMGVAVGDEATKPFIAGRHCELVDICRNCVGNVIGLGIVALGKGYKF